MNVLNNILKPIIDFFYGVVPNYGVAIILFTIFVKAALTPLDLKSRRSMRKMAAINPKMEEIKKKYNGDQEKINQKTQELYKKEKINPLAGCLPMLLSMPILFAMFGVMRTIANEQLVSQYLQMIHGIEPAPEAFLWIKNLWMPDSFASPMMPDLNALRVIGQDVWERMSQTLVTTNVLGAETLLTFADKAAFDAFLAGIPQAIAEAPLYADVLKIFPGWQNVSMLIFSFSVYVQMNGYFVLPLLAVATQFASQKLNAMGGAGGEQAASTNKTMMMLMPLMSIFFCATSSSAFSIYWVVSNIVATVQQIIFNRYFAWQDRKAAVAGEVGIS